MQTLLPTFKNRWPIWPARSLFFKAPETQTLSSRNRSPSRLTILLQRKLNDILLSSLQTPHLSFSKTPRTTNFGNSSAATPRIQRWDTNLPRSQMSFLSLRHRRPMITSYATSKSVWSTSRDQSTCSSIRSGPWKAADPWMPTTWWSYAQHLPFSCENNWLRLPTGSTP
ncbi:hypothetical protein BC939DRAFT_433992, partial [Gamsiella multidivaricata]|uniref:uncharacterized protein n=1 Tax=Gamsiella multidivaricata TaxID=101098 RepID=UPI00221EF768